MQNNQDKQNSAESPVPKREPLILGVSKEEIDQIFIKHGLTPKWDYSRAGQSTASFTQKKPKETQ